MSSTHAVSWLKNDRAKRAQFKAMKTIPFLLLFAALTLPAHAQRSKFSGPPPAEQREFIHTMAERHKEIEREVKMTKKGYTATTTSKSKDLAAMLKKHVAYMKARVDSGANVRHWDPAFTELVKYADDIEVEVKEIKNGVEVVVTGKTEEGVKVAKNHAKIINGFAKKGMKAVQREHKAVVK